MTPSRTIFVVLVIVHLAGVLLAPEPLAPLVAGSVYLPLLPLQAIGIPVLSRAEAGGWPGPSLLGWCALAVLWSLAWWGVAKLAVRLCRRGGPIDHGEEGTRG